jgi:hypothetical protein
MPQDGLFFRVLRRFNILWIALLGVLLIAATAYNLCHQPWLRHHFTPGPQVGSAAIAAGGFTVSPASYASQDTQDGPFDDQVFVLNHVAPAPDFRSSEGFKDFVPPYVANVMVFNNKTVEGAWLFPTNKQVIVSRDAVYEGAAKQQMPAASDPRPVIGMVMLVRAKPVKVGETAKDGVSFYVWTKGTAAAVKLIAADVAQTFGQVGADRYVILYKKGAETRVATYSVPEFKPLSDKRVPDAPK